MAEPRKPVARIQITPKQTAGPAGPAQTEGEKLSDSDSAKATSATSRELPEEGGAQGVRLMMSKSEPAVKRDPFIIPIVGLVLAFSVISLIVQLLIAFS